MNMGSQGRFLAAAILLLGILAFPLHEAGASHFACDGDDHFYIPEALAELDLATGGAFICDPDGTRASINLYVTQGMVFSCNQAAATVSAIEAADCGDLVSAPVTPSEYAMLWVVASNVDYGPGLDGGLGLAGVRFGIEYTPDVSVWNGLAFGCVGGSLPGPDWPSSGSGIALVGDGGCTVPAGQNVVLAGLLLNPGPGTGTVRVVVDPRIGAAQYVNGDTLPNPACVLPEDITGTVLLPPEGCPYLSPDQVHMIVDGLPPGTELRVSAKHGNFINITRTPGGDLGGEIETFDSTLEIEITGTGALENFERSMTIDLAVETHTGPPQTARTTRTGADFQLIETKMVMVQGELSAGDPDFEELSFLAGSGFGLPSPGLTVLERTPSGDFNVDSFFDVTYTIDFVGAPGGQLQGLSGSTTGTVRMGAGETTVAVGDAQPVGQPGRLLGAHPNPFAPATRIPFVLEHSGLAEVRIYDAGGRLVRDLVARELSAGRHEVNWDGRDERRQALPSGTYFYELRVDGSRVAARKAILVK